MVQVDESAVTTGSYTDEELVLAAKKARLQTEDDDNAEEEEEEIIMEELISAFKVVRQYSQKNNLVKELNCCVRALERNCWSEQQKTKKQSSIMSFFSH